VPKLIEMDPNVTVFDQMNDTGGAVVLINKFNVDPEEIEQFLSAWSADAAVIKRQPGFISTQLQHRWKQCVHQSRDLGIDGSLPTCL